MQYARFYTTNTKGELNYALGSDSIHQIDGRFGLTKAIEDTIKHYNRLPRNDYTGFDIFHSAGNRLFNNEQKIAGYIPL